MLTNSRINISAEDRNPTLKYDPSSKPSEKAAVESKDNKSVAHPAKIIIMEEPVEFTYSEEQALINQLEENNLDECHKMLVNVKVLELSSLEYSQSQVLSKLLEENNSLTSLSLSNCEIATDPFAKALRINKTLVSLCISDYPVDAMSLKKLALNFNTTLTSLTLKKIKIAGSTPSIRQRYTAEVLPSTFAALLKNTALTSLNLADNDLKLDGAKALASALQKNTTPTALDLGSNDFGEEGTPVIIAALANQKKLTSLNLFRNSINAEVVKHFAVLTQLTSLNLGCNNLEDNGIEKLAEILQENKSLTEINLSDNSISTAGTNALALALKVNRTLTSLDLAHNRIKDDGAKAIASALSEEKNALTSLNLASNNIHAEGATALAVALKENRKLTSFNLSYNWMGSRAAAEFLPVLEENTTLTSLDLSNLHNSKLSPEWVENLAPILQKNTTLTSFDFNCNFFGVKGAIAFAQVLQNNTTLKKLGINASCIGEEGAKELASALKVNPTLTELCVYRNEITDEGAKYLLNALTKNMTLIDLGITENSMISKEIASDIQKKITRNKKLAPNRAVYSRLLQAFLMNILSTVMARSLIDIVHSYADKLTLKRLESLPMIREIRMPLESSMEDNEDQNKKQKLSPPTSSESSIARFYGGLYSQKPAEPHPSSASAPKSHQSLVTK